MEYFSGLDTDYTPGLSFSKVPPVNPSQNATYSLTVHSKAVLATIITFQRRVICTQNVGPAFKQAPATH